MKFKPKTLDFELSPYTGLTRESWMEAATYLLEGIFKNIPEFEAPVIMPRTETEITYPHLNHSAKDIEAQEKAERFEGLTRTFFIAAPMIHLQPELTVCGYHLKEYYKNQILRTCTKGDVNYVGTYDELCELTGNQDKFRAFQQTVETCALVIGLWLCQEELWDTYTKEEKDTIAALLQNYAHAGTVPQNWRLFNMLDMAFLHRNGYPIDREIMADHAQAILAYSVGDGWYRDGHSFDYYSCWAFNVYAPLWNLWYGYENEPELAKRFEEQSNRLMKTYADFFDRDGHTNMWGRSNIYRNASTSAFDGNFFLLHPTMNPGLARRICSGSLMQFLGRDGVIENGVPQLGFYGQFSPLVQGYSCAESPYWFGKAFLCLHLPKDHPFWTAKEENGSWEKLEKNEVKETVLNGPGLCFSNHNANGATILRTGKIQKNTKDVHGMWNYSKLCFHTKYPWESSPKSAQPDWEMGAVESQQYVLKDLTDGTNSLANLTYWYGKKDHVLYRRQFFDYSLQKECHWTQGMNLADFTVPYGIFRVDKHRLFRRPVRFTLGSYGFPDNGTTITEISHGKAKAVILKGYDATGAKKQMAMTIYDGWDRLELVKSTGTNPDSEHSIVLYAVTERRKQYGGAELYTLISQVITKEDHEDFSMEELFPVKEIRYEDRENTGAYGTITVSMKDGSVRHVNFEEIEAGLTR